MGCTSSAPNMVNSTTAETSIQFEEDMSDSQSKDTEEIIYRMADGTNEKTMLPSGDTLAEPNNHIVRNKSTSSFKIEKDNQEDRHLSGNINKTNSSDTLLEAEKIPKLEQLVGKAVELHSPKNDKEEQSFSKAASSKENIIKNQEQHLTIKDTNAVDDNKEENNEIQQYKEKDDHAEEAISPSQSESSRATRWEALADIAAELPPSLTVDPITGQIYAVSK